MVQIEYKRMLNMSWTKKKEIEPKIGCSSHINYYMAKNLKVL
jgi:hypothetical protein